MFLYVFGIAGQNVSHVRISTVLLLISLHLDDFIGTFQGMVILGKGKSFIPFLKMVAFNVCINYGAQTIPSV
jgi:hypothetical protein